MPSKHKEVKSVKKWLNFRKTLMMKRKPRNRRNNWSVSRPG
jgi:hypothetical protein